MYFLPLAGVKIVPEAGLGSLGNGAFSLGRRFLQDLWFGVYKSSCPGL